MSVKITILAAVAGVVVCSLTPHAVGDGYPVAGIEPSHRPTGAPRITEVVKPSGWYTRALTGISQPYPQSLRFLEDQGNWYTPFNRAGMHGRYDIRGWYAQ